MDVDGGEGLVGFLLVIDVLGGWWIGLFVLSGSGCNWFVLRLVMNVTCDRRDRRFAWLANNR